MRRLLPAVLLALLPVAALAQQGPIRIEDAWSRPAPAGRVGVVYLTATDSAAPDELVGASTPVAARAELHESLTQNGVATMRPVAAAPVAPGKPLVLAPGGYHLMLMDLHRPLKPGETFPLTLVFAKAGDVTASVTVRAPGAAGPRPMHMSGH